MNPRRHSYAEFRSGWTVLLACALGMVCGATMLPFNTLGAVVEPLGATYGWGRGDVQLAYFIFAIASALLYPWVGGLVDKIGARRVALIGIPLFSLAFVSVAFTGGSLPGFYLAWAMIGILGAGTAPITFTRIVNAWFVENRGLALAISLFLGGISVAAFQVASTVLVEAYGWRAAFIGLAVVPLLLAWPVVWMFLHEPQTGVQEKSSTAQGNSGDSAWRLALRDRRFWMLGTAVLIITFSISGIVLNLKPLLHDRGMEPQVAAYVAGLLGFCLSISRLGTGFLIDRFWAPAVAFPLLILPAISCAIFAQPDISVTMAAIAGVFIGVATGAETDLIAYLTVRYFGLENYGKLYGIMFSIFILASGVAPYVFGRVYDALGSYQLVLWTAAVCFVVGASLLLGMGRYPDDNQNQSNEVLA